MQTSYRRDYSAMPAIQMPNNQQFGAQSVLPDRINRFQFQHEQEKNYRSTSFVQIKEPMKNSIVTEIKDRPLPQLQEFEFYSKEPKVFQQQPSLMMQPVIAKAPQPLIKTTVPIQNVWTPPPPLNQSTIPVNNVPTQQFQSSIVGEPIQQSFYWNLEKPVYQPPIVTQTPVAEYEQKVDKQYKTKARDEYCGMYTKTRPANYRSQISQQDPEDKENPYWVCNIF